MKPIILSPSSISLFLECPRCFWLQINKHIRRPSGPFPSLPGGMDKILKEHFDQHRAEASCPEELEKFDGQLFPDLDKLNIWRNNRKGLRYTEPSNGITLMGAIDELFIIKNGNHIPVDFKTRGYPLKEDTAKYYQHQMDIYSFLLEKNGLKTADYAILLFYYPDHVKKNCIVNFHIEAVKMKTSVKNAEKLFEEAKNTIKGKIPPPKRDCPFCNWDTTKY